MRRQLEDELHEIRLLVKEFLCEVQALRRSQIPASPSAIEVLFRSGLCLVQLETVCSGMGVGNRSRVRRGFSPPP